MVAVRRRTGLKGSNLDADTSNNLYTRSEQSNTYRWDPVTLAWVRSDGSSAIYTTAFDYDGAGNLVYYGRAVQGSSKASAVWELRKFTYSGTNPTDMQFADGSAAFVKVWDSRAGYSYS